MKKLTTSVVTVWLLVFACSVQSQAGCGGFIEFTFYCSGSGCTYEQTGARCYPDATGYYCYLSYGQCDCGTKQYTVAGQYPDTSCGWIMESPAAKTIAPNFDFLTLRPLTFSSKCDGAGKPVSDHLLLERSTRGE